MSQTVPTEPGWWWAHEVGGIEPDATVIEVRVDAGFGLRAWQYGHAYTLHAFHWLAPVAEHDEVERLRAVVAELAEHIEYNGDETLTVTLADLLNVSPSRVPSSLRTLGGAK